MNLISHWNKAFEKDDQQLGWYEAQPKKTLELISACNIQLDANIFVAGAGTTTLIEGLLDLGFKNIIANDLSNVALNKLKSRIQETYGHKLNCIQDDITKPTKLHSLKPINLWIDRAVLHFFLTPEEQTAYFDLIKTVVVKTGYVLIAVFSMDGVDKCCGLPLRRYNAEMIQTKLGNDFKLIHSFNFTYTNPFGGERPYIYTLYQRT